MDFRDYNDLREEVLSKVFDWFNPEEYAGLTIAQMADEIIIQAADRIKERKEGADEEQNYKSGID